MGNFQTFVSKVNAFAASVGADVKSINTTLAELINDAATSASKTWSSTKISSELSGKVDKVTGKALSSNDYTNAEKSKLAGLESSKWKGQYTSLALLKSAMPEGAGSSAWNPSNDGGFYGDVDAGTSADVARYIWDTSDKKWVSGGPATPLTAAQVKSLYEANPDTNAFNDAEQTKLGGIETGAQVNDVTSVAGKTGAVTVTKTDVGLGNVPNYKLATSTQAETGTDNSSFMSPRLVATELDALTGSVDPNATYIAAAS